MICLQGCDLGCRGCWNPTNHAFDRSLDRPNSGCLADGGPHFAVSVDEAVAVEKFERENLGPLPVTTDDGVVTQFGSRGKTEALVPMIATEHLLERPLEKDTPALNA